MRPLLILIMPLLFSQPVRFTEALQRREVQAVLPTTLSSEQLAQISGDIKERALFSARTPYASYLDELDQQLNRIVNGEIDDATARLYLKDELKRLDYQPNEGEEGSITDLASDPRINLILDTQVQFAQGYGNYIQGQDEAILDQWPAQELYRQAAAEHPRNWIARWQDAGGEIFGGRMIALKNTPIWSDISRFGTPYPPFDYGSHMWVRDVNRDTAMSLGLIDAYTQIAPQTRDFNQDLKVSSEFRSSAIRQALEEFGYVFDAAGNLTLGGGA